MSIKNQNKIETKFLLKNFSVIREFYFVLMGASNIQYGSKSTLMSCYKKLNRAYIKDNFNKTLNENVLDNILTYLGIYNQD